MTDRPRPTPRGRRTRLVAAVLLTVVAMAGRAMTGTAVPATDAVLTDTAEVTITVQVPPTADASTAP